MVGGPEQSGSPLFLSPESVMADLSSDIETAATGPKSHEVDGEKAVARSIDELIAADRYLASKAAAGKAHGGLRFAKFVPGGAAGTPRQP